MMLWKSFFFLFKTDSLNVILWKRFSYGEYSEGDTLNAMLWRRCSEGDSQRETLKKGFSHKHAIHSIKTFNGDAIYRCYFEQKIKHNIKML